MLMMRTRIHGGHEMVVQLKEVEVCQGRIRRGVNRVQPFGGKNVQLGELVNERSKERRVRASFLHLGVMRLGLCRMSQNEPCTSGAR